MGKSIRHLGVWVVDCFLIRLSYKEKREAGEMMMIYVTVVYLARPLLLPSML